MFLKKNAWEILQFHAIFRFLREEWTQFLRNILSLFACFIYAGRSKLLFVWAE